MNKIKELLLKLKQLILNFFSNENVKSVPAYTPPPVYIYSFENGGVEVDLNCCHDDEDYGKSFDDVSCLPDPEVKPKKKSKTKKKLVKSKKKPKKTKSKK